MMIKIMYGKEQFAHREFNVIQLSELSICEMIYKVIIRPGDIERLISELIVAGFEEDMLAAIEGHHTTFERT